jgi:hypothetical protein
VSARAQSRGAGLTAEALSVWHVVGGVAACTLDASGACCSYCLRYGQGFVEHAYLAIKAGFTAALSERLVR